MSKQTINIGASPNDGTGTPLRTSFDYTNQNFTELYTALGGGVGLPGATTQVIFNDGGTNLAGDAGLVYNKTTDALTVAGLVTAGSATITGALTVDTTTLVVNPSGYADRVGIGTATPADTLDVNGRITALRYLSSSSNASLPSFAVSAGNGAYNSGTNEIGFSINSTSAMTLNSTGLGIAVSPTAAKLQVGSSALSSVPSAGATGHTFALGATAFGLAAGTLNTGNSYIQATRWDGSATNYELVLQPNGGNVGIGVTPSSSWVTYKALEFDTGIVSGSSSMALNRNCYFDGVNWRYKVTTTFGISQYQLSGNGSHSWKIASSGSAGALINGTGAWTDSMTLDTSGNLLVGRTTLFAQPSRFTVESNSQTASICGIFNDARTDSASAINIAFYRNGIKVGSVDCTDAATSYVTSSDYRLKEDVQPLSGGLARVSALKPSIYKWKINGSNGEGFIAHELAEVVPAAVTGEKDAVNEDGTVNPQGVDLSKVVPVLVAAIQELTARLQTLEAK